MKPLAHFVLVKPCRRVLLSTGGLHLNPAWELDDHMQFTVTAVGSKVDAVKPGDRILAFGTTDRCRFPDGSRILHQDAIIATVSDTP